MGAEEHRAKNGDHSKYKTICESEAKRWGVSPEIHPDDFIFHFLFNNPSFQSKEKAIEYYFSDGFSSAEKLQNILKDICGFDGGGEINLLEFASGYGCVTRHIKNVMPFSVTIACDIHPQAVQFIEESLGTEAVLSASRPEDLFPYQEFDVVFALSFFSHMPKNTFSRWLRKLASFVKSGGYFIFTTHGLESRKYFPDCQFDKDGFYFQQSTEQKDIDIKEYGLTCTLPKYVLARIFDDPNFVLKYFHEGYWWKHQDVFIIKRL